MNDYIFQHLSLNVSQCEITDVIPRKEISTRIDNTFYTCSCNPLTGIKSNQAICHLFRHSINIDSRPSPLGVDVSSHSWKDIKKNNPVQF